MSYPCLPAQATPTDPPSLWLAATELPRAVADASLFAAWLPTLLAVAPRGDGHPVLVLPGLLASDASTKPLRAALKLLGHDVHGWGLGRNSGTRAVGSGAEKLIARIEAIADRSGQKVSLVGWSLGGVLARIAAQHGPEHIRQVIALGSPVAAEPTATRAWRLYEAASGTRLRDPVQHRLRKAVRQPLDVPFTAIYSKGDGICAWQGCTVPTASRSENIEVLGSHCGLGTNPLVFHAVADRLGQREDEWAPFQAGRADWLFPSASAA